MNKKPQSRSALKHKVYELLRSADFDRALKELCRMPGRKVINPLFSFLYHSDQGVKWAAVKAMGAVVARLAEVDIDAARIIMRRLMWNLNDESGGIGWGSPEAIGEILACNEALAKEYAHMLISYTREEGNYLEHEMLQRGLLWGIGRLSEVRPDLIRNGVRYLLRYLESNDATVRGLAASIMGLLRVNEACSKLERLKDDKNRIQIYVGMTHLDCRVMDLAQKALREIECGHNSPVIDVVGEH